MLNVAQFVDNYLLSAPHIKKAGIGIGKIQEEREMDFVIKFRNDIKRGKERIGVIFSDI